MPSNLVNNYSTFLNIPIFLVRAGLDDENNRKSEDLFINKLIHKNIHLELINYANGNHAFDLFDDNKTSRDIIKMTIEFFIANS